MLPDRTTAADVWLASVPDLVSCASLLSSWLGPHELERIARYRRWEDRGRRVIGRGVLRFLLSRHLGVHPRTVRLEHTCSICGAEHGPPRLAGGELECSIAYSLALVAFCLADGAVGIDIEGVPRDPLRRTAHTDWPIEQLVDCSDPRVGPAWLSRWTAAEAVGKAAGCGLGGDWDSIRRRPWSIRHLPAPEHVIAVASEGGGLAVEHRGWVTRADVSGVRCA